MYKHFRLWALTKGLEIWVIIITLYVSTNGYPVNGYYQQDEETRDDNVENDNKDYTPLSLQIKVKGLEEVSLLTTNNRILCISCISGCLER